VGEVLLRFGVSYPNDPMDQIACRIFFRMCVCSAQRSRSRREPLRRLFVALYIWGCLWLRRARGRGVTNSRDQQERQAIYDPHGEDIYTMDTRRDSRVETTTTSTTDPGASPAKYDSLMRKSSYLGILALGGLA
jgi:hypothetical protein